MKQVEWIVTERHQSECPNPISFVKGTPLCVGRKYAGDEGWNDWYFCTVSGQEPGWVPGLLIEWTDSTSGRANEDYTAKELDVDPGEILWGSKELNGWLWCARVSTIVEEGWVPLNCVRRVGDTFPTADQSFSGTIRV